LKIDDAEMYFLNFEAELPSEAGGTHIGLFLGWAMLRGLASPALAGHLPALVSRTQTGRDLLFRHCDGKLWETDLTERGNSFAASYYSAGYLQDYLRMFGLQDEPFDELAKVPDDLRSQEAVCARLDRRYSEWRMTQGLPSREVLRDALVQAAGPVLETAGFVPEPDHGLAADAARANYVHTTAWQTPRASLYGAACPDQFYGIGLTLNFNLRELDFKAAEERQIDQWPWGMADPSTVAMPLSSLAEGWPGPAAFDAYHPVLWIFDEAELVPAAEFLAHRLREFALPALARIQSLSSLCDAFNTRPLTASPWFRSWTDHGLPLAFELDQHPALPKVLEEMDAYWRQRPDAAGSAQMRAFLKRVGERAPRAP
jgi:hypothetical protein